MMAGRVTCPRLMYQRYVPAENSRSVPTTALPASRVGCQHDGQGIEDPSTSIRSQLDMCPSFTRPQHALLRPRHLLHLNLALAG